MGAGDAAGPQGEIALRLLRQKCSTRLQTLVDRFCQHALRTAGEKSDNVTVIAAEWEAAEDSDSTSGISTQSLGEEVFASTIHPQVGDAPVDELDDDEIERTIHEINEAIRRTGKKAP